MNKSHPQSILLCRSVQLTNKKWFSSCFGWCQGYCSKFFIREWDPWLDLGQDSTQATGRLVTGDALRASPVGRTDSTIRENDSWRREGRTDARFGVDSWWIKKQISLTYLTESKAERAAVYARRKQRRLHKEFVCNFLLYYVGPMKLFFFKKSIPLCYS